jgi:hypothetical protein
LPFRLLIFNSTSQHPRYSPPPPPPPFFFFFPFASLRQVSIPGEALVELGWDIRNETMKQFQLEALPVVNLCALIHFFVWSLVPFCFLEILVRCFKFLFIDLDVIVNACFLSDLLPPGLYSLGLVVTIFSPTRQWLLGYTNDYMGYFSPVDEYDAGGYVVAHHSIAYW